LSIRRDMLVFRENLYINFNHKRQCLIIAIKFYNSSQLQIIRPQIKVTLRQRGVFKDTHNIHLAENDPPSFEYQNPYIQVLRLNDDDILYEYENDNFKLLSIQGNKFGEGSTLDITIIGDVPAVGTNYVTTYSYALPDNIHWGRTKGVFSHYSTEEKKEAWKVFEVTGEFEKKYIPKSSIVNSEEPAESIEATE
ncbi:MAG: hypothetical protein ACPG7F_14590, partial [Aggregatilineales bacterium]